MWYKRARGFQKPLLGAQIAWGHPLSKGLTACFLFNQKTDFLVYDLVNTARTNVVPNGGTKPSWSTGRIGQCIQFINANDWVEIPVNQSTDFDFVSGFSIVTSFNFSAQQSDSGLFGKSTTDTGGYAGYFIWNNANTCDFYINGGVRADSTRTILANTWYQYVAQWDTRNAQIYIDGRLDVSTAYTTAPNSVGQIFYIGKYNYGSRTFPGKMDYLYIYRRYLTPAEIYWLYKEPYCFIQGP